MFDKETLSLLRDALETMERGYADLPPHSPRPVASNEVARVLNAVALRLRDDYPFFHPLYAGQMQQPPHPIARLAYALALWTNPNNHATPGGRVSTTMEREAVAGIARMIGWSKFSGRLCGGGALANAEAVWVASRRRPGTIVASEQAHYSHRRMSGILGLPFEPVPSDASARIDTDALAARLVRGDVGTVVATLGTTASGAVDALPALLALRERHGFRLHVDASYGGYFALIEDLDVDTRKAFAAIAAVDSIVIDPHKHGLQPYGCSSVLFRDPTDGTLFRHRSPCADSPATDEMQTGFECSRPGAAAVALWATMELLPLVKHGEFAAMLRASRMAALTLHRRLEADRRFAMTATPALDIVTWAVPARNADAMADRAHGVLAECTKRGVHLSVAELPGRCFRTLPPAIERETVTCLRAVLLKAEHAEWVDRIYEVISDSTNAVLGPRRDLAASAGECRSRQRVRRGPASVSRAPTN